MGKATHGMNGTKLHSVWGDMKDRCLNSKCKYFPRYGGRGIIVCNRWMTFMPFFAWAILNGYKQGLQIDRIDNDGGYNPDNCRWVTARQNMLNRRRLMSNNTSGFEGVCFDKKYNKWKARISIKGKRKNLGLFINKQDAVNARNQHIIDNNLQNDYKIQ